MQGLMMSQQLMISDLLEHAAKNHGSREIFSRETNGDDHHYTWTECQNRTTQLANALISEGIKPGDRVATIAWNNYRHLELYYAVAGIGAILHTINPRLDPEQLIWMVDHAEDKFLFFDNSFAPIIEKIADRCPNVEKWVAMCADTDLPGISVQLQSYEALIGNHSTNIQWPRFDENAASTLCYTSGTTGNPKGVLYSHRSTILHAWAACAKDALSIGATDNILAVVPMFHVNAWGLVFSAAMMGAKLVLPGPDLDGKSLTEMVNKESVTIMAGVPTIWLGILNYLKESNLALPSVNSTIVGGSALPESLLRAYEDMGISVIQAWGMTETSPLGVINTPLADNITLSERDLIDRKLLAGRAVFGVDMRIVDDEGNTLPRDGKTSGHLQVRGPWVAGGYFKNEGQNAFTDDGWFQTGDVAALHPNSFLEITDRSKDVIKSGGEWISSIEVENAAMNHPDVALAACIGVQHPKWQERPLLIVQAVDGTQPDPDEIKNTIAERVAKWWVPEEIVFRGELPLGATGKILKRKLKDEFKDYQVPA